jgi:hypothetical protein
MCCAAEATSCGADSQADGPLQTQVGRGGRQGSRRPGAAFDPADTIDTNPGSMLLLAAPFASLPRASCCTLSAAGSSSATCLDLSCGVGPVLCAILRPTE